MFAQPIACMLGACVEVDTTSKPGFVLVRDSKQGSAGPVLEFTAKEWDVFTASLRTTPAAAQLARQAAYEYVRRLSGTWPIAIAITLTIAPIASVLFNSYAVGNAAIAYPWAFFLSCILTAISFIVGFANLKNTVETRAQVRDFTRWVQLVVESDMVRKRQEVVDAVSRVLSTKTDNTD
jgi:uncharacterized membrane protein YhdT